VTGFLGRADEKKEGKEKRSGEVAGAGSGDGGSPGESENKNGENGGGGIKDLIWRSGGGGSGGGGSSGASRERLRAEDTK
jgi:hypothetical protein